MMIKGGAPVPITVDATNALTHILVAKSGRLFSIDTTSSMAIDIASRHRGVR